jgi:hypothetical protein
MKAYCGTGREWSRSDRVSPKTIWPWSSIKHFNRQSAQAQPSTEPNCSVKTERRDLVHERIAFSRCKQCRSPWPQVYRHFDGVSDSTQHSPSSEANSHSATQEIPHLLWNPKVRYRVPRSLQFVPILNHMNPVLTLITYVSKIHLKINLSPYAYIHQVVYSLRAFQLRFSMHSSSRLCVLHSPPISPSLIRPS